MAHRHRGSGGSPVLQWHAGPPRPIRARRPGRRVRRGVREAAPRRPAPRHDRDGAPAHPEDRSRWRSSRPTPSRRPRTPPRRSSSSSRSAARASRSASSKLVPIAIAVAVLLAIVVTSYRQTIFAYPSGGGSYVVSRENLGETPSLVAGASLLVDYILTVAVSISAGVAAIVSIPAFHDLARAPGAASGWRSSRSSASPTCAASRSRAGSSRFPRTSTSSSSARWSATGCSAPWCSTTSRTITPEHFEGALDRRDARPLPAAQGLLVRCRRAHRCRGDLERRARVPPARVEERGRDAGVDGRHPRHAVLRRAGPRAPPRPVPERASRR